MRRASALAALALSACVGLATGTVPALSTADSGRTSAFVCPPSAQVNTSCACTSGCSINSEFSYLWSSPVYPPATRWLDSGEELGMPLLELPAAHALAPYKAPISRRHHLWSHHTSLHRKSRGFGGVLRHQRVRVPTAPMRLLARRGLRCAVVRTATTRPQPPALAWTAASPAAAPHAQAVTIGTLNSRAADLSFAGMSAAPRSPGSTFSRDAHRARW